ncbi:hypothetical protein CTEN210_09148 [Chaetoceros tenuissimus]|uniref:Ankyrin repeat-containing domain n=1 Tax=Chaetoceros tenuissimus TaxID=426638 RepID=A0AAD3CV81_9STRA|nr:hypothetical protein CTEN210_09148 [Chaetoceros tenuissimus]
MSSTKRIKVDHDERGEEATSSASHHDIKHIQDLPNDVFQHCLEFVGKGNFAFVAPVSKHFYWNYINLGVEMKNNVIDVEVILQQGRNKKTTVKDVLAASGLRLATECFLKAPKTFQEQVCREAAVNGRLDILKCAVAFGIDMKQSVFAYDDDDGVSYDISVQLAETVANGHLDVIEFLHAQGTFLDDENIMIQIGKRGKASSLHWMVTKGMISFWEDEVFNYLVRDGAIDILKESYEESDIHRHNFNTCAEGGSIETMNWLLQKQDCDWSSFLFSHAAKSGSIPMMQLCFQNGCPAEEYICSSAMVNKNHEAALSSLKWLRERNVPWNESVCRNAAMYGNFRALKWARENGCPWDTQTYSYAAQCGSIETLDYCFENNCPIDQNVIYHFPYDDEIFDLTDSELHERSLKVYKWLYKHSIPWDNEAGLIAAKEGHLKTLMWAIENGCPWHEDILGCSIFRYNIHVAEYCLQHHSPMDDTVYMLAMNKMNEFHETGLGDVTDAQMIKMLQMILDFGIPWSTDIIPCAASLGRYKVASWLSEYLGGSYGTAINSLNGTMSR